MGTMVAMPGGAQNANGAPPVPPPPMPTAAEKYGLEAIDLTKYTLGKYTAFDVSDEPMYSELALGQTLTGAIRSMCTDGKTENVARRLELLQAWEAHLMVLGHQYLVASKDGWEIFGDSSRGGQIAEQNVNEMMPMNIFGSRKDKIVAAATRQVPGVEFFAREGGNPVDEEAAEQKNNYRYVWAHFTDAKGLAESIFDTFYLTERALLYTRSVADQQAWGTDETGAPAVREITTVFDKLAHMVPMYAQEFGQMGKVSISQDFDMNMLKERHPWVADKITSGGLDTFDSTERAARMSVKSGTRFGMSTSNNVPEKLWFLRPSEYWSAPKEGNVRDVLKEMFPDGMLVAFAGSQLSFVRNQGMNDCLEIRHARVGLGQNRRPIGRNTLPLQKQLNKCLGIWLRFMEASVPNKYADPERVNVEAYNGQANDPRVVRAMKDVGGLEAKEAFYIEPTPTAQPTMFEFIQWLTDGAPELMDNAAPSMFGGATNTETVGGIEIQKDASLAVFMTPYQSMGVGLAKACEQASVWAGRMQQGSINTMVPGQGRVSVDVAKMRGGNAFCFPEPGDVPESETDRMARLVKMLEQSATVPIFAQVFGYVKNLPAMKALFRGSGLEIPGADAVMKQMGILERLKVAAPVDNPAYTQAEVALQHMEEELGGIKAGADSANPDPQHAQMQQGLQQAQQMLQQTPPKVPSVAVAQDASENHQIAAALDVWWMNSTEGVKFQTGNEQEQAGFANVMLNWQGHMQMAQKLTPPTPPVIKPGITMAVDKLPGSVQAKVLAAEYGIDVDPGEFQGDASLQPHEVIQEKTGVDENGVPVKQRIALAKGGSVTA